MKGKIQFALMMSCLLLLSSAVTAQTKEWKNAKTKDGKISTKYKISTRTNESGEEVPLIESVTNTTEKITIDQCIALMKNVPRHRDFHGDDESKLVRSIADNKWLVYYFTEGTIFSPDADGVYTMTYSEDKPAETVVFTITASPTLVEKKDMKRVTYLTEAFTFRNVGNGLVQITMTSNMSPAFQVPGWIMKMSFPDALFDVMKKFVKIAHEQSK